MPSQPGNKPARWVSTLIVVVVVVALMVARHYGWLPEESANNDAPPTANSADETTAPHISGRVVSVPDGDSLVVEVDGHQQRVRLQGIDCPELAQTYGKEARERTRQLALDQQIQIRSHGVDQYDRLLAEVVLPDGKILNEELVRAGCAWHYRKDSDSAALQKLERAARDDKRGLWKDPDPVQPWRWRYENPRE